MKSSQNDELSGINPCTLQTWFILIHYLILCVSSSLVALLFLRNLFHSSMRGRVLRLVTWSSVG